MKFLVEVQFRIEYLEILAKKTKVQETEPQAKVQHKSQKMEKRKGFCMGSGERHVVVQFKTHTTISSTTLISITPAIIGIGKMVLILLASNLNDLL